MRCAYHLGAAWRYYFELFYAELSGKGFNRAVLATSLAQIAINNQSRCFIRCIRIVSLLENFRLRVRSTDRIYPQRYLLSMSVDSIETFATYFKFRDRRGVIRATGW